MQLSLAALVLGLAGLSSALLADNTEGVRHVARARDDDPVMVDRANGEANGNRPPPSGLCCVANASLNEDACRAADGQQGRCVPGGNNCGGTLSCVAQSNLGCTNSIKERGKNLCRAKVGNNRYQDGNRVISNLNQAMVM
ncbi:hypothetical protein PG993_010238 [Apiospora rasikravindrae]|uniref:Uncharacterized protein n=1 Tax=Apiospora rasikravindrae TaxID=990691 RepID=A0ABR1SLP6_9PEZI